MGASRLVDDGLIDFAGGTGYRGQLGDAEKALYSPILYPCYGGTLHGPGLCGGALTPAWPLGTPATEIDLQRADGARLRIHCREPQLPLAALVRTFLETPLCSS